MALSDIFNRTRSILYGSGLGEKPAIRLASATANETPIAGGLVSFEMASGEAAKVKPGNVLSVYDPETEADAHVVYVTSVSSNTVTGINEYLGSPSCSTDADLDSAVFEQNPLATGYEIFEAIDTVFANLLWPWVYDVDTASIASPDITFGTEEVGSTVEEIVTAWQIIGGRECLIPVTRQPWDVHTTLSSTGRLAVFDWEIGSTGYYTFRSKYAEADEAGNEITHLVALGAASILLGASLSETALEATKKDNSEAVSQRSSVADRIWRDFLTLRQSMSEEQVKRLPNRIAFSRG
jgi:hypothetical protein